MQRVARFLIINYEYPPLGGGAGTATRETARALVRQGHAAAVITTQFRGQPAREDDAGVQVFRVSARRRVQSTSTPAEMLSFLLSALRRAPAIARAFRPHAVVCYFSIPSGVAGLWLKKRLGLPYVVSLRGGDVPGFLPGAMATTHRLTLPLTRLVWRSAAAVTANSRNLRQLALRTMPGLDIPVIPNGVDTARFSPIVNKQFEGAASTGLFVGRLNEQKGLDILIRALGSMRGDLAPAFRMILVGGGPEEARLKELAAKRQVAPFLDFRGWVTPESIADAYRAADFFVLPSRDEGMPNVALEALASGLPVIMTDIPGSDALVRNGENGWLVSRAPGGGPDEAGLAHALNTMIHAGPDTRRSMSAAARARAETFSWDAAAHSLAALCVPEI
jgi:glycosyltransferase involved in cell wall biosynthesis